MSDQILLKQLTNMKQRILLKSGIVIIILMIGMLVYAYLRAQEVQVENDTVLTSSVGTQSSAELGLLASKFIS
jgi:cytosine/uracil/thiamine/allantoin permease